MIICIFVILAIIAIVIYFLFDKKENFISISALNFWSYGNRNQVEPDTRKAEEGLEKLHSAFELSPAEFEGSTNTTISGGPYDEPNSFKDYPNKDPYYGYSQFYESSI